MQLDEVFDPSQEESQNGKFDVIPANTEAPMMVWNSEVKTKNGDPSSKWIEWDCMICDGPYVNRHIFHRTTFKNPNLKAEQIGRGQMKDLAEACGVTQPIADTAELHQKVFWGRIGIEKGTSNYPDKNKLTGVWPIDDNGQPIRKSAPTASAQQPPAAAAPPPQRPAPAAPAAQRPVHAPPPRVAAALQPTPNGKPAWLQRAQQQQPAQQEQVPI